MQAFMTITLQDRILFSQQSIRDIYRVKNLVKTIFLTVNRCILKRDFSMQI